MNESCKDYGVTCAQRLDCLQFTDGESSQQQSNNAGIIQIEASDGDLTDLKRRYLKFQNKAFLTSSREILVRECVKLASAIRRATAGCVTPSSGDDDEDDLPYMKLDKVTLAMSRETFGPIYLVT